MDSAALTPSPLVGWHTLGASVYAALSGALALMFCAAGLHVDMDAAGTVVLFWLAFSFTLTPLLHWLLHVQHVWHVLRRVRPADPIRLRMQSAPASIQTQVLTAPPMVDTALVPATPAPQRMFHSLNMDIPEAQVREFVSGAAVRGLARARWEGSAWASGGVCDRQTYQALISLLKSLDAIQGRKAGESGMLSKTPNEIFALLRLPYKEET